jgi:hypothetical protein
MAGAAFLGSTAPVTDIDSLDYPIPIAQHLAHDGEWRFWPGQAMSSYPLSQELLAAALLQSGGRRLGLLSGLELALATVLLVSLARKLAQRKRGAVAGADSGLWTSRRRVSGSLGQRRSALDCDDGCRRLRSILAAKLECCTRCRIVCGFRGRRQIFRNARPHRCRCVRTVLLRAQPEVCEYDGRSSCGGRRRRFVVPRESCAIRQSCRAALTGTGSSAVGGIGNPAVA